MTLPVHRKGDLRICGAVTVLGADHQVFANGRLIAVEGDPNSHGNGQLISTPTKRVFCGNILVINHSPDNAFPDNLCPPDPHCNPQTAEGSPNVFCSDV